MIDWDSFEEPVNLSTKGAVNKFRMYLNGGKGDGEVLIRKKQGHRTQTPSKQYTTAVWQYLNDNPWGDVSNRCFNQLEQHI